MVPTVVVALFFGAPFTSTGSLLRQGHAVELAEGEMALGDAMGPHGLPDIMPSVQKLQDFSQINFVLNAVTATVADMASQASTVVNRSSQGSLQISLLRGKQNSAAGALRGQEAAKSDMAAAGETFLHQKHTTVSQAAAYLKSFNETYTKRVANVIHEFTQAYRQLVGIAEPGAGGQEARIAKLTDTYSVEHAETFIQNARKATNLFQRMLDNLEANIPDVVSEARFQYVGAYMEFQKHCNAASAGDGSADVALLQSFDSMAAEASVEVAQLCSEPSVEELSRTLEDLAAEPLQDALDVLAVLRATAQALHVNADLLDAVAGALQLSRPGV